MDGYGIITFWLASAAVPALAYLYWRCIWFFRNPPRMAPSSSGLLSAADGTVVYVKRVGPREPVITVKRSVTATVEDILREDVDREKVLIGVFMSPFNVHYNRAPLSGVVGEVRHHLPKGRNRHMGVMHLRTLLHRKPLYQGSMHVIENERTVTRIDGEFLGKPLTCYIIQIAGGSVRGIDSYIPPGGRVARGEIFGMIRIGSQVDLVLPWTPGMEILVRPGQRVRAGETILIR
jgi:phosphatidylserine decarboxylase